MKLYQLKQLFLGAASVGAVGVGLAVLGPVPEAKAACLSSNATTNCETFDGTSSNNVQLFGFTDAGFTGNKRLQSITISRSADLIGGSITFSSIAYSFDGTNFLTTNLTQSVSLTAGQTSSNLLSAFVNSPLATIGSNFRLKFTLPAGAYSSLPGGSPDITTVVNTRNNTGGNSQTQTRIITFAEPVPSPLPLLGAGAAFGCSRKLRRRIRVVQAS